MSDRWLCIPTSTRWYRADGCLRFSAEPQRTRKLLILTPTFRKDFGLALDLLHSTLQYVHDLESFSLRFVVSQPAEAKELDAQSASLFSPSKYISSIQTRFLDFGIVSLDEVLCDQMGLACSGAANSSSFPARSCSSLKTRVVALSERRTAAHRNDPNVPKPKADPLEMAMMHSYVLFCERGVNARFVNNECVGGIGGFACTQWKVGYQFFKKIYGVHYLQGWEEVIILDSDSLFVKPIMLHQQIFADYSKSPLAFTSTSSRESDVFASCAAILGLKRSHAANSKGRTRDLGAFTINPPWGYSGWIWQRPVVDSLLAHVERLAAKLSRRSESQGDGHRLTFADAVSGVFSPFARGRCFEPMLYWMWAAFSRTLSPAPPPPTVPVSPRAQAEASASRALHAHRFLSPAEVLSSYFPALAALNVTAEGLEMVSSLLLLKHPRLPSGDVYRGALRMCRDLRMGFLRLMKVDLAKAQSTSLGVDRVTWFTRSGFVLPPDVTFYNFEPWLDQLACLFAECPSLAVLPMTSTHPGSVKPLTNRIEAALRDNSVCARWGVARMR